MKQNPMNKRRRKNKQETDVNIKHPGQVELQMENTLTLRFAVVILSGPVVVGLTR